MDHSGPELVVGVVSPLGVSNRITADALTEAFRTVGYQTRAVSAIAKRAMTMKRVFLDMKKAARVLRGVNRKSARTNRLPPR